MARCFFSKQHWAFCFAGKGHVHKNYTEGRKQIGGKRMYSSIDLKCFTYLWNAWNMDSDPMHSTNLVVVTLDVIWKDTRLAISPLLEVCGIPPQARLFKVKQVKINAQRHDLGTVPCQLWNLWESSSDTLSGAWTALYLAVLGIHVWLLGSDLAGIVCIQCRTR